MSKIYLDGTAVGKDQKPYVIAEVSGNHRGSIDRAKAIISAASENNADCVKLQTYTPDTLTIKSDREEFRLKGGLWDGYTLWDLYDWAHTPFEWHEELFAHARKHGITCFSTPFDTTAIELLESLNVPFYKIASFELTDTHLVKQIAATGKPVIMSTGLATLKEIEVALDAINQTAGNDVILLHCISGYPTPLHEANLSMIPQLQEEFGTLVGLSDHTLDNTAATVAVALGACVIEKHFTLARAEGGPDAEFSMEPDQLKDLCKKVEGAWRSIGDGTRLAPSAQDQNRVLRRSIYTTANIRKGEKFSAENIRCIRPGNGMDPQKYETVLGKSATQDLDYGTPLEAKHVDT